MTHPFCGQLTAVKTKYPLTSITWLYRGLSCRPIEVTCFLKFTADKFLVFNWLQAQLQLDFFIVLVFVNGSFAFSLYILIKKRHCSKLCSETLEFWTCWRHFSFYVDKSTDHEKVLSICLSVPDLSASDEPDDDDVKVKKKQKTAVTSKRKPTTRVRCFLADTRALMQGW